MGLRRLRVPGRFDEGLYYRRTREPPGIPCLQVQTLIVTWQGPRLHRGLIFSGIANTTRKDFKLRRKEGRLGLWVQSSTGPWEPADCRGEVTSSSRFHDFEGFWVVAAGRLLSEGVRVS